MKKFIIASGISIFPLFIFGIINPMITLYMVKPNIDTFSFNLTLLYIVIYALSLSIVTATILPLLKYASRIDKLDDEEMRILKQKEELNTIISKYNELILEAKSK